MASGVKADQVEQEGSACKRRHTSMGLGDGQNGSGLISRT